MYRYGKLGLSFEWDASKEVINIQKHKITFLESVETFFDPSSIQLVDKTHSQSEKRYFWIGKAKNGRILTTWFTERNEHIRIIGSAEFRKFKKVYDETAKIK
jgi:uncharacterized DUF497 family protein